MEAEEINYRIEALTFRYEHAITAVNILSWLRNFPEEEWPLGLDILDQVNYYSSDRMIGCLKSSIQQIIGEHDEYPLILYPVEEVGKSGKLMAYFAQKAIQSLKLPKGKIILTDELNQHDEQELRDSTLVLLDDFSGSGDTFEKAYNQLVADRVPFTPSNVVFLTVAYMSRAVTYLTKKLGWDCTIYGDRYEQAFKKGASPFGSVRMLAIREFCYKYGVKMFPDDKKSQKPLGYENSQSLVAFEHATPNNSLPILWFDKQLPGTNHPWFPIFPRFPKSRINRSVQYRQQASYWLALAKKINLPNIDWAKEYSQEALQLLTVIDMKYHHKSDVLILRSLSITPEELENIYINGRNKKLFDAQNNLTASAVDIYNEIRRMDQILGHHKALKFSDSYPLYIPNTFLGVS